nr:MAG: signal recognition particle GTPase [Candidatus Nanosalinarum sp. J07AB56]
MLDGLKDAVKQATEDVKSKVAEKEITEEALNSSLESLRLRLIKQNISIDTVERIQDEVKTRMLGEKVRRDQVSDRIQDAFRTVLEEQVSDDLDPAEKVAESGEPYTLYLVGFNGSGKTTTAAKLTNTLQQKEHNVVLGAGDTFRAASIEQLEEHGKRLGTKVVSHEYESDPAAVAYDAVAHAEKEGKVAVVDTAGRSHADQNLMNELEKMIEVGEPDMVLLVVDALAGNDVENQVEAYQGMFDGLVVTKMDVDEHGGALITAAQKSGKPVAYIGTGQEYTDLEDFDTTEFTDRLFE